MADGVQVVTGRDDWDMEAVKVWIAQLRVGALVVTTDGWDGRITEAGDGT